MHKYGPSLGEVEELKIIVNKKTEDKNMPPFQNRGSIDWEKEDLRSEEELVRKVYEEYGPGKYTLLWTAPGRNGLKPAWRGDIMEKDNEVSYAVEENKLRDFIVVKEKPWTGRKRVLD